MHLLLGRLNRAVRIDDRNCQRNLTSWIVAVSVRCRAPVFDIGFDVLCDGRLLQVIGNDLIAGFEIRPRAVQRLILPCTCVIAHMRQRGARCCLVNTIGGGLLVVRIQPDGHPIIYSRPIISIISIAHGSLCIDGNAVWVGNALIRSREGHLLILGNITLFFIDRPVRDPVFQRQIAGQRIVRSFVNDLNQVGDIANLDAGFADGFASKGDRGLISWRRLSEGDRRT